MGFTHTLLCYNPWKGIQLRIAHTITLVQNMWVTRMPLAQLKHGEHDLSLYVFLKEKIPLCPTSPRHLPQKALSSLFPKDEVSPTFQRGEGKLGGAGRRVRKRQPELWPAEDLGCNSPEALFPGPLLQLRLWWKSPGHHTLTPAGHSHSLYTWEHSQTKGSGWASESASELRLNACCHSAFAYEFGSRLLHGTRRPQQEQSNLGIDLLI